MLAGGAGDFFCEATEGLAKLMQKIFKDRGRPNAYIVGEEPHCFVADIDAAFEQQIFDMPKGLRI